jgi:hypothetical protein
MSDRYIGYPENQQVCPAPPYNATNFTPPIYSNPSTISLHQPAVYSTLITNALTQPQYPLPTGSNAQQIYRNNQNISFFTAMNRDTQYIKSQNRPPNTPDNVVSGSIPYPQFRSEAQRLMYIQGQALAAARNKFTGLNPSVPIGSVGPIGAAGVPCSTIYGIIAPP